jgi:hypothetical protein
MIISPTSPKGLDTKMGCLIVDTKATEKLIDPHYVRIQAISFSREKDCVCVVINIGGIAPNDKEH